MFSQVKFALVRVVCTLLRGLYRVVDLRAGPMEGVRVVRPAAGVVVDRSRLAFHGDRPVPQGPDRFQRDAVWWVELPDAEVIGKGIVIDRDRRVVLESTLFQKEYLRKLYQDHLIVFRRLLRAHRHGAVVPLINFLDRNYFHWMMEALPRLIAVEEHLRTGPWKILVDADAPPFVRETLAFFFGLGPDRVISDGSRRRRAESVLLPSYPFVRNASTRFVNAYDPGVIQWMNRAALARAESAGPPVDLLISRRDCKERQLVNEERILERFPALDLRVVRLGEMPFAHQAALFARARSVIGAHGAGLANLLVARSPLVIELYPRSRNDRDVHYFSQISSALGFEHHIIDAPAINEDQDMQVDERVLGTMEEILQRAGLLA